MNKETAIQFIHQLFANVWTPLDKTNLADYYHKDVVAHFGHQTAHYNDIVHRLEYVKHHFGSLKNDFKKILVDGDEISVLLEQTLGESKKSYAIMAIYHIKEGKVSEMWACIDPQINYFE
jgi:predicted SnoaL-like aldol condensation-catalyzing enzyme